MIIRFIVMLVALLLAGAVCASPLPVTFPQNAGVSTDGISNIDSFFAEEIAGNRVPGAVIAIARDGKLVHYRAYDYLDKVKGIPMPLDAIFGYASMTKIMTCVAALKLTQEGRLPLKSKLSSYFPAFAEMKVGVLAADGKLSLEPQKRPIFIYDLFRHTSGLTYGGRGDHPISKLYPEAQTQHSMDQQITSSTESPNCRWRTNQGFVLNMAFRQMCSVQSLKRCRVRG